MDEKKDAERVVLAFQNAMNQYADSTILIHKVWADTSHSACVLYERVASDLGVIGHRITLPPNAIEGNPESTGEDWAQDVRKALGTLPSTLHKDERGISWFGVREDRFPSPTIFDGVEMTLVQSRRLILIGYWDGPETHGSWPSPGEFVDANWDAEERDFIASYLQTGLIARSFMGYSRCRFCGQQNGSLELSDGLFVWPEGLAHYVAEHAVRLPDRFVRHAFTKIDGLESALRDVDWWQGVRSTRPR